MLTVSGMKVFSPHRCLNRVLATFAVIAMIHGLTAIARAQGAVADEKVASDGEELLKAETDLKLLHSGQFVRDESNMAVKVERRLENILQRDPSSPFRFQIEQDLDSVGEILAPHHLAIATMYMKRWQNRGAQSRLLQITSKYPHFSQMDEVLFKLAEVSLRDEVPDDACVYLRKLVSNYPVSRYVPSAFEMFNQIAVRSGESTEKPERQ